MNVVITAATKGIGLAVTEIFASKGANIAFCARTEKDLKELFHRLSVQYPDAEFIYKTTDMSKEHEVKAFTNFVKSKWTEVDVLVNNAGVFLQASCHAQESENAFKMMMDTNLYSTYFCTQGILPLMPENKNAYIFNICSIASFMPYGAYAVSKHAMLGYSRALRAELKAKGIRVSAVMPGATKTDSWAGVNLPEERFMLASDIAEAIWSCYQLSNRTVVEEIILRPVPGDI